ncbi:MULTISPECIES: preprotein translocase subunit SecE [unclassified Fusibacter]|jgi:preprotein translocase subunit SecE|uniref:preprotein translocase subunit SecE n=1 Tax=unclassified Fusibacter TaxID=2624464 RepID=UPI0010116DB1|nr:MULTISPECIES: preprotein translocase subunit SecE [unclassified Fusibacter]MCK8061690.1 preprotein translocase subunit SecE [Fusibacter sp. A2]NPE21352.1 preprotein translocase subunit SecE [Fusibacter sp. A1]RXV61769.1 preprotein translocase subunit SecE [Fusibacter sp. A1]
MNSQTQAVQQKTGKKYFKGVISETKKVIWPTRKELVKYVAVVVTFSAMASFGIWVADIAFRNIVTSLIQL